jgi:hypothetical protein
MSQLLERSEELEKLYNSTCNRTSQVRGATLKVLSKSGKQRTIHWPLQKLISFEIAENNGEEDKNVEHDEIVESNEGNELTQRDSLRRWTRKAAVDGQNPRTKRTTIKRLLYIRTANSFVGEDVETLYYDTLYCIKLRLLPLVNP